MHVVLLSCKVYETYFNFKIEHSNGIPPWHEAQWLELIEAEWRIYVSKLIIIGSDNGIGLSPVQRQAIIWTNTGILSLGPLWTNFNEILIEIDIFPLKKCIAKWLPFCLGLHVLKTFKAGINLCMHLANDRRHYSVTPSLTGQPHTQNAPCSR